MYRGTTIRIIDFSLKAIAVKGSRLIHSMLKEKNCQLINLYSAKISFTNEAQ